jgi:heme/copper-type cytochrome/quinol oxidase subunit 2
MTPLSLILLIFFGILLLLWTVIGILAVSVNTYYIEKARKEGTLKIKNKLLLILCWPLVPKI